MEFDDIMTSSLGRLAALLAMLFSLGFLAHLVYQPKSLIESCFSHRALALVSVHTSPGTGLDIETSYFGPHVHICLPYMHIKHLVILTYSF